jgi:serine/threonine protein kinase
MEFFGQELTEFERMELSMYNRIFTIGNVRRQNQYSIADKDGQYLAKIGEQIAYRYQVVRIID